MRARTISIEKNSQNIININHLTNITIMRKQLFICTVLLMCAGMLNAQLKVASDGKVGIGVTAPLSNLAVNTVGDSTAALSVEKTYSSTPMEYIMSVLEKV